MIHLPVFISFFSILIGMGALILSLQQWRQHHHGPWGHLFRFVLFYNGLLLVSWISQYACLNIFGCGEAMAGMAATRWFSLLNLLFALGMQQAMVDIALEMTSIRRIRAVRIASWGLVITTVALLLLPGMPDLPLPPARGYYWIMLITVMGLAVGSLRQKKQRDQAFFIPILFLYTGVMISLTLSLLLPSFWRDCLITTGGVMLNGGLLIRLLSNRRPALNPHSQPIPPQAQLEALGLSSREAEIAQLVLAGLSNKEIEAKLCISHHTVKNHLYRMYQRVGVNSRAQFMHLLHGQSNLEWHE